MTRAEVIAKLKAIEPALRAHGVAGLYLFGSYARDQAGPDSDLDVFVDKVPGRKFGFDELMGSYHALCDAIPGIEISYGTRAGLSKYVKSEVHFLMAATKNPRAGLGHIRDEIEAITIALRGTSHDAFIDDYVLRRAAERALLIISEAAKALPIA